MQRELYATVDEAPPVKLREVAPGHFTSGEPDQAVEKNELGEGRNARRFAVKREAWIQKKSAKLGRAHTRAQQLAEERRQVKLRQFAAWAKKFRARLVKVYGMTEAEAQARIEQMLADPESVIHAVTPASPVNDGPFFGQEPAQVAAEVTP